MKLKVDENLPEEVAALLRADGHDVETVLQEGLGGAKDPRVLAACQRETRSLVTLDTDFANIVAYPPSGSAGLVVLRPSRQSKPAVLRVVASILLPHLGKNGASLPGTLWVVDDVHVRQHV